MEQGDQQYSTAQGTSRVTVGQTDAHTGDGRDGAVYVQVPEDARPGRAEDVSFSEP